MDIITTLDSAVSETTYMYHRHFVSLSDVLYTSSEGNVRQVDGAM